MRVRAVPASDALDSTEALARARGVRLTGETRAPLVIQASWAWPLPSRTISWARGRQGDGAGAGPEWIQNQVACLELPWTSGMSWPGACSPVLGKNPWLGGCAHSSMSGMDIQRGPW